MFISSSRLSAILMAPIMRKRTAPYIPIRDIGVLIATSPALQGLARRNSMRPCRPWIWSFPGPDAHSSAKQQVVYR
ncbi:MULTISPECIES: protein GbcA [Pseudomonas]|uniref:Protein GbcA n=1 Tax=Pseudomonas mosselii TaxID=78327 RepID=A0A7W2PWM5_9PSED|nr:MULTISPECIES: protein GbcA [Pseudomonas]MBA6063484.1 protein GbcA [Pseudomonas mosselii]MBC3455115.1 protein GbcA [Pseudomonas mosselii]MBH3308293.1 protein GbcA [Pseudomonas mosselii]MBH3323479.1 protein GbcA [Pseudomonas mosselii]MBS9761106.1 protein GbcA [Pseudomonas mosselii]